VAHVQLGDARGGSAAFHHVMAAAAVHVQVDEAGQDQRAAGVARCLQRHRGAFDRVDAPPGIEDDRAVDESVGSEDAALQP